MNISKNITWLISIAIALGAQQAFAEQILFKHTCKPGLQKITPTKDFIDNNDGTVTHKTTGLMWKKCSEGQSGNDCAAGTIAEYRWSQALQSATAANVSQFAGYSDWRLPNIKELLSIVELTCQSPSYNLEVFPNVPPDYGYWSSSPASPEKISNGVTVPGAAWGVYSNYGYVHKHVGNTYARLVRTAN